MLNTISKQQQINPLPDMFYLIKAAGSQLI